jgi:hypothetical protein
MPISVFARMILLLKIVTVIMDRGLGVHVDEFNPAAINGIATPFSIGYLLRPGGGRYIRVLS